MGKQSQVWWKPMQVFDPIKVGWWLDAHWVLILAQNTKARMDSQGPWVLLLAPSTKAGCMTRALTRHMKDSKLVRVCWRVHERTWTSLSGVWLDLELPEFSRGSEFESWISEFESWRLDLVQHWFGVFVSVGHKGVMGHNTLLSKRTCSRLFWTCTLGCYWSHLIWTLNSLLRNSNQFWHFWSWRRSQSWTWTTLYPQKPSAMNYFISPALVKHVSGACS